MNERLVRILCVQRYPEFVIDVGVSRLKFAWWNLLHEFRIGRHFTARGLPIISMASGSSITIGDYATIISRSRNTALGCNHASILRTLRPTASIRVGEYFKGSGIILCAADRVTIGDRVVMGANAVVTDTDFHSVDSEMRSSAYDTEQAAVRPVCIGSDVFIGCNVVILKGVSVGDRAVIGAGAVVTKDVPTGAVAAGNPARVVKQMMSR